MEGALGLLPAQLVPWSEKPGFQARWPFSFRRGTWTFFSTLTPWAGSLIVPVAQMLWMRPHMEAAQRAFQGQVQRQAPLVGRAQGKKVGDGLSCEEGSSTSKVPILPPHRSEVDREG